jgi:SAM-dependent methyltransferase
VRDRLTAALPDRPRVAEAGCGTGLLLPDLYGWGVTPRSYRGFDTDPGIVAFARFLVPRALRRRGYDAVETARGCRVDGPETGAAFEVGDALDAVPDAAPPDGFDLVVAQSFLDLVALDRALDALESAVRADGLLYAPLTFDGETVFLPEHPADERVFEAFHADIDRTPGRDSRAGRHLLERLRERAARVEGVAASDWIVRPRAGGRYHADERSFLASILGFVAGAVTDVEGAGAWLETRRRQLLAGELTYVAHGYDVLWRPGRERAGGTDG